jgi:conjugal transfer/type IV secretion protein DotA/TraY
MELPDTTKVAEDDLGGRILSELLGGGWDSISGGVPVGEAATLARDVLEAFNWAALAAVVALFAYVMAQGIAGTAVQGVPLGRRFSSLWVPLRFAFSISLLAPIFKGLSLFQVFMLLCVGYSVNLANHIWDRGLDFFVESGGMVSLQAPQDLVEDGEALGSGALRAMVVQEYYRVRLDRALSGPIAAENHFPSVGNVSGSMVLTFSVPEGGRLAPGDLGRISIPCQSPSDGLCAARLSAVRGLISDLQPLAAAINELDRTLGGSEGRMLGTAVSKYQYAILPHLATEATHDGEKLKAELARFKEQASKAGWISAGAYYWNISRLNEKARQGLYSGASFSSGPSALNPEGEVLEDFGVVMGRLERYLSGAYSPERGTGATGPKSEFPSVSWFMEKLSGSLGRYGLDRLIEQLRYGDPISTLSSLGNFLVGAAEVTIGVRVAAMGGAYAVGETSSSVLGQIASAFTGSVGSAMAGMAQGAILGIGPYILMLSVILISYGFFLAYFLPALPFILWMSGVLGWLVLLVESLVAAPLWVAAHALPEGEGMAGNAARRGYTIFLGVLLRPPLMVFGFLLAMALLTSVGRVIGHVFSVFGFGFLSEGFLGVSGFLAFSVILGAVVVTAVWKLFGLMGTLPERVIGWIGGHVPGIGEHSDAMRSQAEYGAAGALSTQALNPITRPGKAPKGANPKT